jgi:hypothetical protein
MDFLSMLCIPHGHFNVVSKNKGINGDVPILLITMIQINVGLPCLKAMIPIPDLEHLST